MDVSDPVGLVNQLEQLTGAVDYEELIQQHSSRLEQLAASMEHTKAEIDRWALLMQHKLCNNRALTAGYTASSQLGPISPTHCLPALSRQQAGRAATEAWHACCS